MFIECCIQNSGSKVLSQSLGLLSCPQPVAGPKALGMLSVTGKSLVRAAFDQHCLLRVYCS